jgi:hypothetical protein
MTKEEFLQYQVDQRREAAHARIKKLAGYGECKPLTDNEWDQTEISGKSRFKTKLTQNEHWKS